MLGRAGRPSRQYARSAPAASAGGTWPSTNRYPLVALRRVPYICPELTDGSFRLKTERVEARLSPDQRPRFQQAAEIAGESTPLLLVAAAVSRADDVAAPHLSTIVPPDYFDELVTALDVRPTTCPASLPPHYGLGGDRGSSPLDPRSTRSPNTTASPTSRGVDELDDWLATHARTATGHGTWTDRSLCPRPPGRVVGYFAVAPHTIDRGDSAHLVGARRRPCQIPAILLGLPLWPRIGTASGSAGQLLVMALRTIVGAARRAGGKFVVIDAIDELAAAFYAHHDFEAMPRNPLRLT